jgi:hypothetical protein
MPMLPVIEIANLLVRSKSGRDDKLSISSGKAITIRAYELRFNIQANK